MLFPNEKKMILVAGFNPDDFIWKFFYTHPKDSIGGVRYTDVRVFNRIPHRKGREAEGEEIAIGTAACSPVDNFSRKVGRVKALGRALSVMFHNLDVPFNLEENIADDLADLYLEMSST